MQFNETRDSQVKLLQFDYLSIKGKNQSLHVTLPSMDEIKNMTDAIFLCV